MHSTKTSRAKAAWALALGLLVGGASPARAQLANRTGHTATLLADGSILIVGGSNTSTFGGGLTGANQVQVDRFGTISNAPQTVPNPAGDGAADIARSSHTATLLPDGNVLVAGGISAGGAVRKSVVVWQQKTATWIAVTGGAEAGLMPVGRYNHTATLLRTGAVLICGGVTREPVTGIAGDVTTTCDLYRPFSVLGCPTAGGCLDAAAPMASPRALHTATLLPDGRVFITGGWDPFAGDFNIAAAAPVLVTSELYTPTALPGFGAGTFGAANSLLSERYNHTATLMGNGKVLIAGGFNGRNVGNNFGALSSSEIYDPTANSIVTAGTMKARRQSYSIALTADGLLHSYGGLGNVTTSFYNVNAYKTASSLFPRGAPLQPQSVVNGATDPGSNTLLDISGGGGGGILVSSADFTLAPDNPSGVVEDGFVLFSSPTISNAFFEVDLPFGTQGPNPFANFGLCGAFGCNDDGGIPRDAFASLKGSSVYCNIPGDGTCGHITRSLSIVPTNDGLGNGTVSFFPLPTNSAGGAITAGAIFFQPHPVSLGSGTSRLCNGVNNPVGGCAGASTLTFPLDIAGLPKEYFGSSIGPRAQFIVTSAQFAHITAGTQFANVSITSGVVDISGLFVSSNAVTGLGEIVNTAAVMTQMIGTVVGSSTTAQADGFNPANDVIGAIAGTMRYTVATIKMVGGESFDSDAATVTIHSMIFADDEQYDPAANAWSLTHQTGGPLNHLFAATTASFGQKAVLTPAGTQVYFGGQTCNTTGWIDQSNEVCPSRVAVGSGQGTSVMLGLWTPQNASMSAPRINHTATALPDGTVLIAGGSNGPNALNSADVYDPVNNVVTPVGPMGYTRDLHTSTLLPNGRVLMAGGFSTTVSTGSTAACELYYPGQRSFVQTASLKAPRDNHAAVLTADGNVMVIGGYDSNSGKYLSSAEIFFSSGATWGTPTSVLTDARAEFAAALLQDGRVMVAGGVNSKGVLNSVEIYDPVINLWQAGAPIAIGGVNIPLHSLRLTMLADGRVLATGGNDGVGERSTSLIFDPTVSPRTPPIGQWSTTNSLNIPRFNHGAVVLPNGAVAVVGGAQSLGQSLNSVETFDVFTSSWQITGNGLAGALTTPRASHATLLTSNGFIVAIGGSNNGVPLSSIERIYFEGSPDARTVGAPPSVRQPSITVVDFPSFAIGSTITLSGLNFKGVTEASSGGANNASHHNPRITLQALESSGGSGPQGSASFLLDISTRIYMGQTAAGRLYNTDDNGNSGNGSWSIVDSSISIPIPEDLFPSPANGNSRGGGYLLPFGWYQLRVAGSSLFSNAFMVHSGPFLPTLGVGNVAPIPNPAPSFYASETGVAAPSVWVTSSTVNWQWPCSQPLVPYCPPGAVGSSNGFDVYTATSGVFLSTVSFSTNVFTQSGLAPNTTASIIVAPFNLSGDGPLSYSVTTYTLSTAPVTSATSVSSITFASFVFSWSVNKNSPATVYEVQESTDNPLPGGNGQQPFTTSFSTPVPALFGLTTNFTLITGLLPANTYYLRVRAMNGLGAFSNYSAPVATQTRTGVTQPTGVAQNTYQILWTWPDAFLTAPSHYVVYNASSGFIIGNTGVIPQFLETGLSTNTQNSIQVAAFTSPGMGPLSPSASAYTLAAVPGGAASPVFNVSTGSLTTGWGPNQNPLGTTYQSVINNLAPLDAGLGPNFSTVTTTGFAATYRDLGVGAAPNVSPPASLLNVNIYAVNGDGFLSAPLAYGTTSLLAATPANAGSSGATPNSISAVWGTGGNVSTATYEVTYTSTNFINTYTAVPISAHSNQTSVLIGNLLTGTTYQIRVRSFDFFGVWNGLYNVSSQILTPNGGAPAGSLSGVVNPTMNVTIAGTLAGFRPISLFIPAHSFPSTVTVTLSTVTASSCANGSPLGIQITVAPPLEPIHPAFLTMGYTNADVASFTNLTQAALERVDPTTGICVPLSTNVDQPNNSLTAEINHFSLFQLAQVIPPTGVDTTLIFPNPFMATESDGYVTFSRIPAGTHVRIFTLQGASVNDGYANASGLWIWGGTNRAGRPVASGIYFAVVQNGDDKKIFKVVVLR